MFVGRIGPSWCRVFVTTGLVWLRFILKQTSGYDQATAKIFAHVK